MGVNKVTPIENFPTSSTTNNNNKLDPNYCELQEISSQGSFSYLQTSQGKLSARSFDVRATTKTSLSNTIHVSNKRLTRPETPPKNNYSHSIFTWFRYNCLTMANLVIVFVLLFILFFCVAFALTIVLFTGHVSSDLSNTIISVIRSKVVLFMNERLENAESIARMAQQDIKLLFNPTTLSSHVGDQHNQLSSNIKDYLSSRLVYHNLSSVAMYFENDFGHTMSNTSSMYRCQLIQSSEHVNNYIWENQTFNSDLNTYQISVQKTSSNLSSTQHLVSSLFQTSTESNLLSTDPSYRTYLNSNYMTMKELLMKQTPQKALEGLWTTPYKDDPKSSSIFYLLPIFNDKFQFLGIGQVEYGLTTLADLMKSFACKSKGYVLLSDLDTNQVVASSLPIPSSQMTIYEINELNVGKLLKYLKSKSLLDFTSKASVNGIRFEGLLYNVLSSKFSYNAINLGLTVVLIDEAVQKFHTETVYLAISISLGFVVIGLIMAFVLGILISKPLKALSVEFGHIKHMDLEKVKLHFSVFGEFQVLFQKLEEMVVWLNDVRSFIPNSILLEIRGDSSDSEEVSETEGVLHNTHQKEKHSEAITRKSSDVQEHAIANIAKGFKTYQEYSVLYMRIMGLELLSVTDRAFYFEKVLEISTKIAKKNNGDIQLLDISRIRIYYCDPNNEQASKKVISMALKILSTVAEFSTSMVQQGKQPCNLIISVSTQRALVGNIGTKEHRIHTIVSRSISLCEQMMLIAKSLNITLIVDSNSCSSNLSHYVHRPVDRITVEDDHLVIYEVFRENQVDDQEWMYELDQKEKNSRYDDYLSAFEVLLKGGTRIEDYREAIQKVRRFKSSNSLERDLVADHLISMLERVLESCERGVSEKLSPQFSSSYQYSSRIYTEWENKFGMDVLRIRPVEIVNNK